MTPPLRWTPEQFAKILDTITSCDSRLVSDAEKATAIAAFQHPAHDEVQPPQP